jgi:hypothetical protein
MDRKPTPRPKKKYRRPKVRTSKVLEALGAACHSGSHKHAGVCATAKS